MMNGTATKHTDFTSLTYDTLMNTTHSLETPYCCPHTYNFLVPKASFWDYSLQEQFLLKKKTTQQYSGINGQNKELLIASASGSLK